MESPSGYNCCEQIQGFIPFYSVPDAALLWCGVPIEQIQEHLGKAVEIHSGIFSLPYMPCFEKKCKVIHWALNSRELPVYREQGNIATDHVTPNRRHVRREDLKVWIAKNFPDDKPEFLFDKVERSAHSSITTKAFQALQVELIAKDLKLNDAKECVQNITKERDELKAERDKQQSFLKKRKKDLEPIHPRSETTYLNTIGAMLKLMLSSSPAGKKHSVYDNQAAIVDALLSHYDNGCRQGIKRDTLAKKFAAANEEFKS
jgi:hypothetical protein